LLLLGRRSGLAKFGVLFAVVVGALALSGCEADPAPLIGVATAGDRVATVSWQPPVVSPAPIAAYVVTPWIGSVMQTPVRFNSTTTTQIVTGLTNGVSYTFTVHAVNALGNDSASSASSNSVTPVSPRIAAGDWHTCEIVNAGAVRCWGRNTAGQLGNGSFGDSSTPVPVSGLTGAVAIDAGTAHTCALLAAGTVSCWGNNGNGQLGNGTTTNSPIPVSVNGLTRVTALTVGSVSTCAVETGGAVKCWGYNQRGQLGDGTNTSSSTPVAVTGLGNAVTVAIGSNAPGDDHTCALVADGTVYCWGYGSDGELGNGQPFGSNTPVRVADISDATALDAGRVHTCALVPGGDAKCWGWGSLGELGTGFFGGSWTPVPVADVTGASAITAHSDHSCVIVSGGVVQCWGANFRGQLGDGTIDCSSGPGCDGGSSVPVTVVDLARVSAVAVGGGHTCALNASGSAYCWGANDFGQLGTGATTSSSTPIPVLEP